MDLTDSRILRVPHEDGDDVVEVNEEEPRERSQEVK
jgi:hypothetical protein